MQRMKKTAITHECLAIARHSCRCLAGNQLQLNTAPKSTLRGFSLLEVLLVLVLAGILMGVVATSLSDGPVLRKSARDVAVSLRHARSIAILQQKPVVWSMDVESKTFWMQGAQRHEKRVLHRAISAKVNTASSEVASSSQGNIRFFPDGSSTGGSVELKMREQTYAVNVEWISGRVSTL